MSFRSLPPLPPSAQVQIHTPPNSSSSEIQSGEKQQQQHEILISNQSNLLMGVDQTTTNFLLETKAMQHRKWVKLTFFVHMKTCFEHSNRVVKLLNFVV